MGKPHPVELRERVVAVVKEGHGHRGEPSARHWSERDDERAALSGFAEARERQGEAEAGNRIA